MKLGIISDIHEDIIRLKEAFAIFRKKKCRQIVCLGDITGYSVPYHGYMLSRNAHEVIELLKKRVEFSIMGNHDLYSIKKLPKYKARFPYPKNWYSLDYWARKKLSDNRIYLYEHHELSPLLTKKDERFINRLPEYVVKKYDDKNMFFSHSAYPDLVGTDIFDPDKPGNLRRHFAFMKKHDCTIGFSGHAHYEGVKIFTKDKIRKIPFNKTVKIKDGMTWFLCPSVLKGEFANGVLIFDTEKMNIRAIPLNSKIHKVPRWKDL